VLNSEGRGAGFQTRSRFQWPALFRLQRILLHASRARAWCSVGLAKLLQLVPHLLNTLFTACTGGWKEVRRQLLLARFSAKGERSFSLTDSNIEWQNTYEYRAETVTVITEENKPKLEIEGDDTPEIKILANDIFPPAVPTGLQAVSSGPGQKLFVDLVWAPVSDMDLDGYNLYRHEDGTPAIKRMRYW